VTKPQPEERVGAAKVRVKVFAHLMEALGGKSETTISVRQGSKVTDLVNELVRIYGEPARRMFLKTSDELNDMLSVLINGKELHVDEIHATMLKDGDEVVFLPPITGG